MGSKIQGEGDHESARRYNDETQKFVQDHTRRGEKLQGSAEDASDELTPAEKKARSHAKSGGQDARDAKVLTDLQRRNDR